MARLIHSPIRKCGKRKTGGVYLVSEGSSEGVLPAWTTLHNCPAAPAFMRGMMFVDGSRILAGHDPALWSLNVRQSERKRSEVELFGMPLAKRCSIGEASGATTIDKAYQLLLSCVMITPGMLRKAVRNLTLHKFNEEHPEYFALIIAPLFDESITTATVVDIVGHIWRVRDDIPNYWNDMAKLLTSLGFILDSFAYVGG